MTSTPTQCPPYISLKTPLHIHHPPQLRHEVLVQGVYCSKPHYYPEACQPFHTKKVTSSIGILAQLSKHWVFHYAVHIISSDFYRVTAHPSFLIVTLIHLPTIAALVLLASKPLLWLGLGLWTSKSLSQQQACLIEVFPMISVTDPMVIIVAHCPIDLTW